MAAPFRHFGRDFSDLVRRRADAFNSPMSPCGASCSTGGEILFTVALVQRPGICTDALALGFQLGVVRIRRADRGQIALANYLGVNSDSSPFR